MSFFCHNLTAQTLVALVFIGSVCNSFSLDLPFDRTCSVFYDNDVKLVQDKDGPVYEAVDAKQDIATAEFWRAMKALAKSLAHAAPAPSQLKVSDNAHANGRRYAVPFSVLFASSLGAQATASTWTSFWSRSPSVSLWTSRSKWS